MYIVNFKSQSHLFDDSVKLTEFPLRWKIKMKKPLQWYLKTMSKQKSLSSSLATSVTSLLFPSPSQHSLLSSQSLLSLLPESFSHT